jgi:predicted ATPase
MWKMIDYIKETQLTDELDYITYGFEDNSFIGSLLDRVPASHCVLLKLASVIGDEFQTSILREILPQSLCTQAALVLKKLENAGFITGIAHDQYAFTSPLFRPFLYNLLPPR